MTFLAGDELPASDLNNFAPGGDITLTSGADITWGGDTNLYRGGASQLKSDDAFVAVSFTETSAAATVSSTQATLGTTTSASYTATLTGGTACGTAFVAPASGKVLIHNASNMFNSVGNHLFCTVQVRTGSSVGTGTIVHTASDGDAIVTHGTAADRHGATLLVTGLTPASSYNVQQLFKAEAGTASFSNKHLIVVPVVM